MLRAQLRARARAEACSTSSQNKIKSFFQKVCQEREELKNVEQSDDDSIGSVPKEFLKKRTQPPLKWEQNSKLAFYIQLIGET